MSHRVAILDIGSNSLKCLVAEPDGRGGLRAVMEATEETRISEGISRHPPRLANAAIERGVHSVQRLWAKCKETGPLLRSRIVATSAVRSAVNGHLFTDAVRARTGCEVEVLTGEEEAQAIALGVRTDPLLGPLRDFTVFDLGGGSMEIIEFAANRVHRHTSLPLGGVRLSESFFSDCRQPIPMEEQQALLAHVRHALDHCGVPLRPPIVGCSGGLAILRAQYSRSNAEGRPAFPQERLLRLCDRVCSLDMAARIRDCGLPEPRADIFPAALLVFRVLLEMTGTEEILPSTHNLRYGLAAKELEDEASDTDSASVFQL